MSDTSTEVRDWASFGLGTLLDDDSAEIRDALLVRVSDSDQITRCEALVGLARRKDGRIVEPLIRELEASEVAELAVEAAAKLGDPRCYPALKRLYSLHGNSGYLDEALVTCSPTRQ